MPSKGKPGNWYDPTGHVLLHMMNERTPAIVKRKGIDMLDVSEINGITCLADPVHPCPQASFSILDIMINKSVYYFTNVTGYHLVRSN